MRYDISVSLATPCSQVGCGHKYGIHAMSYDEKNDGCLYIDPGYSDQRDNYTAPASRCKCTGFQITYRPPRPGASTAWRAEEEYR